MVFVNVLVLLTMHGADSPAQLIEIVRNEALVKSCPVRNLIHLFSKTRISYWLDHDNKVQILECVKTAIEF